MRIIFDLRRVGLGNNGGSSTLIKSGNTLLNLGHDVFFIDTGSNKHTWTKLETPHLKVKNVNQIPDADVIIATGYNSVHPTVNAPPRCGKKFHWIRGWETWQMPESQIVKKILNAPTNKIVNGLCLQRKLKKYNCDSEVIRPGYDLDDFYQLKELPRQGRKVFVIGGLYTKGKHVRIKRPDWVLNSYQLLKKKYKDKWIQLWMFGNDMIDGPHSQIVDKYLHRPNMKQKNEFYNSVDVWLSPARQEGLHMPPAEAMMTECPVVGTDVDMSGTEDYLVHNHNGFVSDDNLKSFMKYIEMMMLNDDLRYKFGINARKKIEEIGNREKNMKKMVEYFMETI